MFRLRRSASIAACLLGSIGLAGCGSSGGMPPMGEISGKVTYKGEPLSGGTITFHAVGTPGKVGVSLIKPDGTYRVFEGPIGETKVTIDPKLVPLGPPGASGPPGAGRPKASPAKPTSVPAKYLKVETTTLTFTVKHRNDNVYDIELTD